MAIDINTINLRAAIENGEEKRILKGISKEHWVNGKLVEYKFREFGSRILSLTLEDIIISHPVNAIIFKDNKEIFIEYAGKITEIFNTDDPFNYNDKLWISLSDLIDDINLSLECYEGDNPCNSNKEEFEMLLSEKAYLINLKKEIINEYRNTNIPQ